MAFPQFVSVAEDLQYLRNEWASGTDDATLRRGTAILRRLLVDKGGGVLLRIWRATGFEEQPTVTAADLDALLGGDYRDLAFAAAGGAKHEGMWIGCVVQRTRIEDGPPDLGAIERSWPLRDYV